MRADLYVDLVHAMERACFDHVITGLVATMTTGFYPPYLAARLDATLDHSTGGCVGLNLVTARNDRAAQNFGLPRHRRDHRWLGDRALRQRELVREAYPYRLFRENLLAF